MEDVLRLQLREDLLDVVAVVRVVLEIVQHQAVERFSTEIFLAALGLTENIVADDIIGAVLQRADLCHDPRQRLPCPAALIQPAADHRFGIAIVIGRVEIVDAELHGAVKECERVVLRGLFIVRAQAVGHAELHRAEGKQGQPLPFCCYVFHGRLLTRSSSRHPSRWLRRSHSLPPPRQGRRWGP